MRTVAAVIGIVALLGVGAATQTTEKTQTGEMCRLKVSGMHCGACADSVEKAAKKVDGVTAATVSHPKGTAEIMYDPSRTTPDAIAKAITAKTPFKAEVIKPAGKK